MGEHVEEDLAALHLGQLPLSRRAEVEAHVAACAPCGTHSALLQRAVAKPPPAKGPFPAAPLDAKALERFTPLLAKLFSRGPGCRASPRRCCSASRRSAGSAKGRRGPSAGAPSRVRRGS